MQISDDEINILVTTFFLTRGKNVAGQECHFPAQGTESGHSCPGLKKRRQKMQKCDDFAGIYQDRA